MLAVLATLRYLSEISPDARYWVAPNTHDDLGSPEITKRDRLAGAADANSGESLEAAPHPNEKK